MFEAVLCLQVILCVLCLAGAAVGSPPDPSSSEDASNAKTDAVIKSLLRCLPLLGVIVAAGAIALDYFAHARAYQLDYDTLHEPYDAWEKVTTELFFVIAPWLLVALIQGATIRKYSWLMDFARVATLFPVYFTLDLSSVEIPMWWRLGIPPQTEGVPLGDFDIGWTVFFSYPLCILTVVSFAFYKLNTGRAKITA